MFAFLEGLNLSKYVAYAVGVLLLIASITGGIIYIQHVAKKNAQIEFNNQQLQQTLKDQKEYISQLEAINKNKEESILALSKANDDLKQKLVTLNDYLDSDQAQKDSRESSEVLKRTIKELSGANK